MAEAYKNAEYCSSIIKYEPKHHTLEHLGEFLIHTLFIVIIAALTFWGMSL
jgi:hypothetical protein